VRWCRDAAALQQRLEFRPRHPVPADRHGPPGASPGLSSFSGPPHDKLGVTQSAVAGGSVRLFSMAYRRAH
jgi:hypothetical protein